MRISGADISVIICAYTLDRWSDLVAAVESVRVQSRAPSQVIVVVDHNDALLARARETFPELTVVPSTGPKGLSGARNTGLALATGSIVAFLDDDAVAVRTWLAGLAAGYSADTVLGVGGFIAPMWETERPGWFPEEYDWVLGCTYRGMLEGAEVRNLIGANMSFRRDVLVEVGGFSTELGRTSTAPLGDEETGACIRASQLHPDGVFIYASRARVDHRVPASRTTWRYFRQRCYAEGISKAHLSRAVGAQRGLSSERKHAFVTLPAGVGRALRAFVGGDGAGLGRAVALVGGLGFAGAGYVVGQFVGPANPDAPGAGQAATGGAPAPTAASEAQPARPRVLMVTPRYFPLVGGVEHHVAQVARLMADGADVTVLTTDTTGELPADEVVDGVRVVRVRAWPRNRDWYFAPRIWRTIVRGEWDLVHVQSYHTAVAPLAMLAALRAHIPYVLTFHGGGHSSALRRSLRGVQWTVLRPLLARARKLIAVAEFEAERFSAALRLPRERFVVIPNGSDLPAIPAKEATRLRAGRRQMVAVGRLEQYKGHQRIIEAMPVVLREFPDAELRIIGSGPYQPELERLIARLDVAGSVTIRAIPPTDRRAMARALAGSSLFVLMSEFETHPLAVIEALTLGRPALVADTSGLAELAQSGLARAVPLDISTVDLAATIVAELRDPRPVPSISAPTWKECARRLLTLYSDVLDSQRAALAAQRAQRTNGAVPPNREALSDIIAEADAGMLWVSNKLRWDRVLVPALMTLLGVACVAMADGLARQGVGPVQALWWIGIIAIFAPAAATLLFGTVSRTEAVSILALVGLALYIVKLVYAPGTFWGYDELLHYRTADNILTTGRLFTRNSLLQVSPFYPGLEAVTAVIVKLTGLTLIQAGMLLIGVARVLTVVAVFLLLERVATPSRFAAPATLFYMTCPSFLYFEPMFAYESLALGLALVCIFVLHEAQLEDEQTRRNRLNIVGALLLLTVVVTHHVTSFILVGTLVIWSIAELYNSRSRRKALGDAASDDERTLRRRVYLIDLPGSGWVPVLGVFAVVTWLLNVAEVTINYLWPQISAGLVEVVRIIQRQGVQRQLFQSSAGHTSPLLERVVAIGSVAIILVLIPFGMKYVWERRHATILARIFAIGALGYPAILALRFTQSGWSVGSRATAFVYLPLCFVIACGLEPLIARYVRKSRLGALAVIFAATIIFTGGIIAGSSPVTRIPSPYNPGVAEVPYDVESLAASDWAATKLGPGHRFAADSSGGLLIGSMGRQYTVTSEDGVLISELFVTPDITHGALEVLRKGRIGYVLVDRRIAGSEPLKGFIYEPWERRIFDYGSSVSTVTVDKFDSVDLASKQFDSGNIEMYDLRGLSR